MEDKQKRRVRFNLFDVLIILLAVAVGVGVLALRNRAAGGSAETARTTVPMRCTVEIMRAPSDMVNQMRVGDDIYRSTDSAYIGKIAEVRSIPHVENEYDAGAGRYVRYEDPKFIDIYVTIEGEGYSTARDIIIGAVPIKVCGEMYVKGKGFARMGYVCAIDTMGAQIAQNTAVGAGAKEAVYVVRLDDMRDMLLEYIHPGDRIYEKISGALIGTVEDVWTEPYGETRPGPEGAVAFSEKEGVNFQYIRLRGRFIEKADGYYLDGGTELKVGAQVNISSQYFDRAGVFHALESVGDVK